MQTINLGIHKRCSGTYSDDRVICWGNMRGRTSYIYNNLITIYAEVSPNEHLIVVAMNIYN